MTISDFVFQLPMVLCTLQRSIYAVALGKPTKPDFFTNGVPKNSLIDEVMRLKSTETDHNSKANRFACM